MFAALHPTTSNPRPLVLALAGAVGLAIMVLVAPLSRGPDLTFVPDMAARPVELPDGRSILVQRFEVTITEWNECHASGACALGLRARPDQNPKKTPATGINYDDAQQYVRWINGETGHDFRLPTVAEWSFMARPVLPETPDPIFTDPALTWASSYLVEDQTTRALKAQGSFATSSEGISDLDGNVWEWTQDCYSNDVDRSRCPAFFVGGEHVAVIPFLVRDPARGGCAVGSPPAHLGMRLVLDNPPNDRGLGLSPT